MFLESHVSMVIVVGGTRGEGKSMDESRKDIEHNPSATETRTYFTWLVHGELSNRKLWAFVASLLKLKLGCGIN